MCPQARAYAALPNLASGHEQGFADFEPPIGSPSSCRVARRSRSTINGNFLGEVSPDFAAILLCRRPAVRCERIRDSRVQPRVSAIFLTVLQVLPVVRHFARALSRISLRTGLQGRDDMTIRGAKALSNESNTCATRAGGKLLMRADAVDRIAP